VFASASAAWAAFVPWDPLVADSWIIEMPSDPKIAMRTVNAGDYDVGFDRARNDGSGRGMKALSSPTARSTPATWPPTYSPASS